MNFARNRLILLAGSLIIVTGLGACSTQPGPRQDCPTVKTCPECPESPEEKEEAAQPEQPTLQPARWGQLPGWDDDELHQAWPALKASCSALLRRAGWEGVCAEVHRIDPDRVTADQARSFFESRFQPWQVNRPDGSREGLVTGYFEPLIEGSRHPAADHPWPIHGVPDDLYAVDLSHIHPELQHMRLRGRIKDNRLVPYWTREEISRKGASLPAPVLMWAADPIDLFFLQVQGSGQVELPDGSRARIGYAEHNGHPYRSIGRWLVDEGELSQDQASMQGIKEWARANPERLEEMLHTNPSYVFFRELPPSEDGPIGAQGVPLTAERSIAIDPQHIPLGAPVFLDTTHPNSERKLQRLVLAQDTGGAIKGEGRADFFWGLGEEAGTQAGRMRQQGRMWVLLPKGMSPPQ